MHGVLTCFAAVRASRQGHFIPRRGTQQDLSSARHGFLQAKVCKSVFCIDNERVLTMAGQGTPLEATGDFPILSDTIKYTFAARAQHIPTSSVRMVININKMTQGNQLSHPSNSLSTLVNLGSQAEQLSLDLEGLHPRRAAEQCKL